jgi:lipoyl(octanoyl) transferase
MEAVALAMGESVAPVDPEWIVAADPVPYATAVDWMDARVSAIAGGTAGECVWLLEHPPVITAGTSASEADLLAPGAIPVVRSGRGGRHTWHGPGQRVAYVMLDLARRGRDVRSYVHGLEGWVIAALGELGLNPTRSPLGTGVWMPTVAGPAKIAAIGVRIRRWVTFHGVAINVAPDLAGFRTILPCGIAGAGVCRLVDFRADADLAMLDAALQSALPAFLASLSCPAGSAKPVEAARKPG